MLITSNNAFLDHSPVMQSDAWAEFQQALGKKVTKMEGLNWSCILIEQQTRLGRYWLAPYGPFLADPASLPEALKAIKDEAQKKNLAWVVVEPYGRNLSFKESALGIQPAIKNYNPAHTVINDLGLDDAVRWSALSPTYRNLINRAENRGLTFTTSTNPHDIHIFTDMIDTVAKRKGVSLHNARYFEVQAKSLMPVGAAVLEISHYEGKPVASALILQHGAIAHYAYAGSHPEARKVEAGTVLLWQSMQNAKKRGIELFDMFGVAPLNVSTSHPWQGFSNFKRKFGGEDLLLGGTWEIPINQIRYQAYRAALPFVRKFQKI